MHNFSGQKGSKIGPQGSKMKILKEKKTPPGICQIYKCPKLQRFIIFLKSTVCPKVKKHTDSRQMDRQTHIVRF